MKKDKFDHSTTQKNYKKDEAKRSLADINSDMNLDSVQRKKMLENITERLNWELMDMMQYNDTFIHFMRTFFRYCFEWGEQNGMEFWNVGVDGKESFLTRDGKNIIIKACYADGNPNPMTKETKTKSGLILPKGM